MTVSDARRVPLDAVFGDIADRVFPAIRDSMRTEQRDPRDRDAFLMARPAVELLRDLRPDEGLGSRMAEFQAFVHHAYLCWAAGGRTVSWTGAETTALLRRPIDAAAAGAYDGAHYAQFAPRLIWARLEDEAPFEPLDGCFVSPTGAGDLAVLGIFGFHPERAALTVAEAMGMPPPVPARFDGSEPFAPLMDGGARAGLYAIASPAELLFLGAATIPAAQASG